MQEFSSVTASSYDADSLAPLLAEKSAEGWSVISIVAAGTNIVAYLQREADETEAAPDETDEHAGSTDDAAGAAALTTDSVDEPAGWAVAPESESSADTATDDSLAGLVAEVEAAEPAVAEPAATAPAAAESAVPAGWYADPSGRFELRYWDGTAWTEHVSRAGQQFTDPPVA